MFMCLYVVAVVVHPLTGVIRAIKISDQLGMVGIPPHGLASPERLVAYAAYISYREIGPASLGIYCSKRAL